MKKQQATESAPETSIERYYRKKNERQASRAAMWQKFRGFVGIFGIVFSAVMGTAFVVFALVGGFAYFCQTEGLSTDQVSALRKRLDSYKDQLAELNKRLQDKADKPMTTWDVSTNGMIWVTVGGAK